MSPRLAKLDPADCPTMHTEPLPDLYLGPTFRKESFDLGNVSFSELGVPAPFAAGVRSRYQSVGGIIGYCSPSEMPRVGASPVVANVGIMARLQAGRARRSAQFERDKTDGLEPPVVLHGGMCL